MPANATWDAKLLPYHDIQGLILPLTFILQESTDIEK